MHWLCHGDQKEEKLGARPKGPGSAWVTVLTCQNVNWTAEIVQFSCGYSEGRKGPEGFKGKEKLLGEGRLCRLKESESHC